MVDPAKEEFQRFISDEKGKRTPRDVVNYIVQNQFEGSPALVGMLQRSVKTLAEQLNACDEHFILELIQNSEDNDYGSASPVMLFRQENDRLYVACNEIGMKATDVYALCNIGDSTKKSNKDDAHGYIGEKGIGFKSIFKIAHTVEIFSCWDCNEESNMWKFNLTETPRKGIGYIVPEFIESVPSRVHEVWEEVSLNSNRPKVGGTCLVLHLKSGKCDLVTQQIQHIKPQTIMFLRKINEVKLSVGKIEFAIKAEKTPILITSPFRPTSTLFRCNIQHTVQQATSSESYIVYQDTYEMTTARCKERDGVRFRSLSLAIPKNSKSQIQGSLFAFLPTEEETYLPYHINGDFILTASRDSLLSNHTWNQLLFNHLVNHVAFAAYYLAQMQIEVDALQLVPTYHPQSKFFVELHKKILDRLKPLPIVPIFHQDTLAKGADCVTVPNAVIKLTTNPALLANFSIVDPKKHALFALECSLLGVREGDKSTLERIIESQLPNEQPDPTWFSELYSFMASHNFWKQNSIVATTKLRIILLADGRLTTFGTTVYLPFHAGEVASLSKWFVSAPVLDERAIPTDPSAKKQVVSWFKANKISNIDTTVVASFIKEHLSNTSVSAESILEAVSDILKFGLCSKFKCGSLPFVSKDRQIIRPPFSLEIIKSNNQHLPIFGDSDRHHFLVMATEYDSFSPQLKDLFDYSSVPPLPRIFSWMHTDTLSTKQVLDLLSILTASKSMTPGIQNYLNTRTWLPTTQGPRNPSYAYLPTPELKEMVDQSSAFVLDSIYNNVKHKEILLKYTRVIRNATLSSVAEQLELYKTNNTQSESAVIPLLKFLLDKEAKPAVPYCEAGQDQWQWKNIADCFWEAKPIQGITTSRLNLAKSTIDLSTLKSRLERNGLCSGYTTHECIAAWHSLSSSRNNSTESVEAVLTLVYSTLTASIAKENSHLPVWCGSTHQFQPRNVVVYRDNNVLANGFEPDQLKLLWVPPNSDGAKLAQFLEVNTLSSVMVSRLKWSQGSTVDTNPTPLFGPIVRKALCCWHSSKYKSEWKNGCPERVQQLLRTSLKESSAFKIEIVKCAKINGECIESSLRKPSRAYFDFTPHPPVLRRALPENETLAQREFAESLTKFLKVDASNKENLRYYLEDAIRSQKDYPIRFRLDLEGKFPVLPLVCKDPKSTAYVEPVSKQEKESSELNSSSASIPLASHSHTTMQDHIKNSLQNLASAGLSLMQMESTLENLLSQTRNKRALEEAEKLTARGQLVSNLFSEKAPDPRKLATSKEATKPVTPQQVPSLRASKDSSAWDTASKNTNLREAVDGTREIVESNNPLRSSASWDRVSRDRCDWATIANRKPIPTYSTKKPVPQLDDSDEDLPSAPSGGVFLQLNNPALFPKLSKNKKRKARRQRAAAHSSSLPPKSILEEIDPHLPLDNPAQRDGDLVGRLRVVAERPNQGALREAAIRRYGKCVVSGTPHHALLEAAHVKPKSAGGADVDNDENILLLRLDIHRMFDMEPPLVYFTRAERSGYVRVHFTGGAENITSYSVMNGSEIALHPLTIYLLDQYGPTPPLNAPPSSRR